MSDTPNTAAHRRASKTLARGEPVALTAPPEAVAAREEDMRDSAYWTEGVLRVSEPMRIGKHEWRLVVYRSTTLHYVAEEGGEGWSYPALVDR